MDWQKFKYESDNCLMSRLNQTLPPQPLKYSYTDDTGIECWCDYYEDGYTPEDAYAEDCSNG